MDLALRAAQKRATDQGLFGHACSSFFTFSMSITPSNNFLSAALPFCPEPEANSWVNHTYQSPFSDFSIYSSDGHEFKVYKYQLMAARWVPTIPKLARAV